ncbi:unnamed protein product, partial [Polarella glacialis]
VRFIVRTVVGLGIDVPQEQRTELMASALWGSVLVMSPEMEIMEGRVRGGMLSRGDPIELLSLAQMLTAQPEVSKDMFQLLAAPVIEAFATADFARSAE